MLVGGQARPAHGMANQPPVDLINWGRSALGSRTSRTTRSPLLPRPLPGPGAANTNTGAMARQPDSDILPGSIPPAGYSADGIARPRPLVDRKQRDQAALRERAKHEDLALEAADIARREVDDGHDQTSDEGGRIRISSRELG
jgi:hypothetical protein